MPRSALSAQQAAAAYDRERLATLVGNLLRAGRDYTVIRAVHTQGPLVVVELHDGRLFAGQFIEVSA